MKTGQLIMRTIAAESVVMPTSIQKTPKLNRSQRITLELLAQVPEAISAQNLYMLLRQKQPIGLATVYRVLETLKRNGLIRSRINQHSESLYSIISKDEHCLTCINCGESVQIDKCPIQAINHDFDQSNQFKIYYHTLEFFGSCKLCTEKSDR